MHRPCPHLGDFLDSSYDHLPRLNPQVRVEAWQQRHRQACRMADANTARDMTDEPLQTGPP